jgi:hypothetical protein
MAEYTDVKWGSATDGTPATVTWSFASSNWPTLPSTYQGYDSFDSFISSQYQAVIRSAFLAWELICGIDFVEVTDSAASNIRLGNETIDGAPAFGSSVLAQTAYWFTGGTLQASQIYFDSDSYVSTEMLYAISVHEIGHAIGFDHGSDPNSIMYPYIGGANADGALTADDIAGAQFLYGPHHASPNESAVVVAFDGVLRTQPSTAELAAGITALDTGTPLSTLVQQLIAAAGDSTIPSLIVADFVNGVTPTSQKLDQLAAFAESQYAYYAAMGVANPALGPYEALGMGHAETAAFIADFGLAIGDGTMIASAYQQAFGRAPTQAQAQHFQAQVDYFEGLYATAGLSAETGSLRARGAVVGQMLGYAAAEAGNDHADAARAFLVDASDGSVLYGTSLMSFA